MILFFLLIFNIQSTKPCDPAKHLSTLLAHTSLQVKSLFAQKNLGKFLDELSHHDIQCHRNSLPICQNTLLKGNKKLFKRISQSDSDFKEASMCTSMLFNYVIWGLPERVQLALQEGLNPNSIDEKNDTPIMYALDQYNKSMQNENIHGMGKFQIIIQDLLHHGSIIHGNTRYNCPFTFAKKNNLVEILELFDTIQNRRIETISRYFMANGFTKKDADGLSIKMISSHPDLMGLSAQERNELIAQNYVFHGLGR